MTARCGLASRLGRPRTDDSCGLGSRTAGPDTRHRRSSALCSARACTSGKSPNAPPGGSVTNYMRVAYVTGATRPHGNKRVAFGHYYRCCRGSPLRLDTDEDPPSDRVLGSTHVALCTGGAAYIGHANFSGTPQPGYVVQGANAGSEATKHDTRAGCRARSRRPHRRPGRTWRPWLRLWPCRRRTRVAQWRQLQPEQ